MTAFGRAMLAHWQLDPDIVYLNHGTVGATPRRVLAAQQAIRDEIERQPARYLIRELADLRQSPLRARPRLRVAADAVGEFLGARGEDLVFVDNATAGANAVLRSFPFAAGDEILVTDHGYGAVTKAAEYVAARAGATVRVAVLPYPNPTADGIVQAIAAAITPRTRMLVVDHVTSGSALILPIGRIAARARAAGVAVLVDGAHAPGALALDVPAVGADWYAGNLHKWAMAPRSCGVLWVAPPRREGLHALTISWGFGLGIDAEFDWVGTRDPSPWLASVDGIAFMRELGVEAMREWNHALAWSSARALAHRWSVALACEEAMVGTMVTLPLPAAHGRSIADGQRLKDALLYEDRIEAQIHAFQDRLWLRLSGQVYNDASDVERLARAIDARA